MIAQQPGQRKDSQGYAKTLSRRAMRRRPSWVSHFRRVNRTLASSMRMIETTMAAVALAAERAVHSPVRTIRDLHRLSAILMAASIRLERAVRGLNATSAALARDPRRANDAARLLMQATRRWLQIAQALDVASERLFTLQEGLMDDVESGRLAMEAIPPRRRQRIAVTRLLFARDFLQSRRSRAHDRIASIPLRRRRTACRATTDAPRRICRGRAPPVSPSCLL